MRRASQRCLAAALAVLAGTAPAVARAAAGADPPAANAAALQALSDMGAYLRSLEAFRVSVATTDEDVLDDGQKVQYDGQTELLVERPNRQRATLSYERRDHLVLNDGSTVTVYPRRLSFYASAPAPSAIQELSAKLATEYGTTVPLADLFQWGSPGFEPSRLGSALDVGPSSVGGVTCHHYLFRQAGSDWQIWIQRGPHPLPRKLVITTLTDEARPQHTAVFTWDLSPPSTEAAVVFDPPEGAGRLVLSPSD